MKKSFSKQLFIIIIVTIISIIFIPIIINFMLFGYIIPSPEGLGNKEWLSFYGNFSGGALGGLTTLVTVYITFRYYEKKDEDHKLDLINQQAKHEEEMKEQEIKAYKPIISMQVSGHNGNQLTTSQFSIIVTNVGNYPLLNLKVNDKYYPVLTSGKAENCEISTKGKNGIFGYSDTLSVYVEDPIGNAYNRIYKIKEIEVANNDGILYKRYYYHLGNEKKVL